MPELSGPQVLFGASIERSNSTTKLTYAKLRKMRRDPVLALVRLMFFSGVYAGKWSFEGAASDTPEEHVEFIRENFEPLRRHFLSTAALGCFDFGWQPFEKVMAVDLKTASIKLVKLKALLQDNTSIEVEEESGAFIGFKQGDIDVPRSTSLLCNFDVEGTMWEGQSTLANAEGAYDATKQIWDAARRYDQKIAGAHWVVRYPAGKTPMEINGETVEVPNEETAAKILRSLQASGMIAIPIGRDNMQALPNDAKGGWDIELVTTSGTAVDFNARFDHLDKQKCRACGFPERSLLEGQFGTKAEAETHTDFVTTMIEYRHACLLELLNWHAVNQLLVLNFGQEAENTVKIVASPLADDSKKMLSTLYDKILSNADGFLQEIDSLDLPAIAETLGIPRRDLSAAI